jgi:hypothetical protein
MPTLKEFFEPMMKEGPRDGTFKPAPEVKPAVGADPEAAVVATGDDMGAMPGMDPAMTQDVAKMSSSSLSFFTKNVNSVVQKFNLMGEGFAVEGLTEYATSLDDYAYNIYAQVGDPAARQAFEADYQKMAADWSRDLAKQLQKIQDLKKHIAY